MLADWSCGCGCGCGCGCDCGCGCGCGCGVEGNNILTPDNPALASLFTTRPPGPRPVPMSPPTPVSPPLPDCRGIGVDVGDSKCLTKYWCQWDWNYTSSSRSPISTHNGAIGEERLMGVRWMEPSRGICRTLIRGVYTKFGS